MAKPDGRVFLCDDFKVTINPSLSVNLYLLPKVIIMTSSPLFCMCYIDDILVTGPTNEAHLQNLEEVFRRLKSYGIRMKKEKCHFMRNSVTYLGHVINSEGIYTPPPTRLKLYRRSPHSDKRTAVEILSRPPKLLSEVSPQSCINHSTTKCFALQEQMVGVDRRVFESG